MSERVAPEELKVREPAARTLLARAQRLRDRAARAKAGSNERRKCLSQAMMLASCAQEVATDPTLKADWAGGWRALASGIVSHASARERKAAKRS